MALTNGSGRSLKPVTLRRSRCGPETELINSGSSHAAVEVVDRGDGLAAAAELHSHVRELRAPVYGRVLARLDLQVRAVDREAPARRVGLLRALDVAGAPELRDHVVNREARAGADLLRRGVDAGAVCEDLAAKQSVDVLREDVVVVAEQGEGEDHEGDDGGDSDRAYQTAPPAPPEALGRLLELDDARRARPARRGGRDDLLRRMTQGHRVNS